MDFTKKIEEVKKAKSYRGKKELIAHLEGKNITRSQAMVSKCFDCMGYFADGIGDCNSPDCPMYNYRPYKTKRQFDNAEKPTRVLTEEHKKAMQKGRKKNGNKKV